MKKGKEKGKYPKYLPFAFTEQGVAMLSSVLKSKQARKVNVAIMRAFVQMRKLLGIQKELSAQLKKLENKIDRHDEAINAIFEVIRKLMPPEGTPRKQIGYKSNNE